MIRAQLTLIASAGQQPLASVALAAQLAEDEANSDAGNCHTSVLSPNHKKD